MQRISRHAAGAAALAAVMLASPLAAAAASEQAVSADAFVDTIGLNTHLGYEGTAYFNRFPEVQHDLLDLGVRHIRDTATPRTPAVVYDRFHALEAGGIRLLLITDLTTTPQSFAAVSARLGGALEAAEPPNELDISKDANWLADARSTTHALYAAVKGLPATHDLTVLGPSLTRRESYAAVGDLSGDLDFGNLHNYYNGRPPGFRGYGPQHNASIAGFVREASPVHGSKRVFTTETGYCTNDRPWSTPASINGVYEPRIFLEQFMSGVARTYQYQLADYGTGQFSQCGLLTADLQPRPSFNALHDLIATLSDRGAPFRPGTLNYTLGGATADVDHLLLQKRDGTMYLALWVEKNGYDIAAKTPIAVPAQRVTLNVEQPVHDATVATFGDDGHLRPRPLEFHGRDATLELTDHVSIVRLP